MKQLFNKSNWQLSLSWMCSLIIASVIIVSSCHKEELNVQQDFPFEVKVMPIPSEVPNGHTVEIRATIQRAGNFNDAKYYIRYFQFDGQGTLQYYSAPPYVPNDLYELPQTQFRLYYTSLSAVSQSFDIWISDNFGNEKQVSFQFNNSDK